ncbi:DUF874 domain-containing protein [Oceaniglobus ichthyenteri]|uniref:DUF874 domain-containing protein n=1 Tax=Oceaniglobus ichthyenteri TaxID=2136177 RepID=UPI00197D8F93|nr:DUF874 domain-containing protein [Oceaniglobus ichthyenteri]
MGPIYSVDDFLDMVRRHLRLIVGLVLLGSLISLMMAANQQHMYRSAEVLQIERPKIANELAPSTVAGSSARRLQLIEQQIMARGSLAEIIEELGLFSDIPDLNQSEKINRLRQSVTIEGLAAVREGFADDGTISVLTITANMPTAEQAQAVARELSARTIALSAASRSQQTQATLEFFTRQEQQLLAQIKQLEDKTSAFRAENELAIPGSLEFRRSEIQTLNTAILDVESTLISVRRQLDQVDPNARRATRDRQIAEFEAEIASLTQRRDLLRDRVDALYASIETSPEVERTLAEYQRQMVQLQGQLDVISTRRAEAEVGARLEARSNAEQLTVLEAAPYPDYPYTASKKRTAMIGGVASVFVALAAAFLLDLRTPVLRSAAQMKRETGLMPVVSIPYLEAKPIKVSRLTRLRRWLQERREAHGTKALKTPIDRT